jgi:hypothetical protein
MLESMDAYLHHCLPAYTSTCKYMHALKRYRMYTSTQQRSFLYPCSRTYTVHANMYGCVTKPTANAFRTRTTPTVYSSGGERALDKTSPTDVQTPPSFSGPATYDCFQFFLI